ncbi:MAG: hypothetical protein B7Z72_06545 [Gemmatimonadetes bacterium 21-71-4]|nr:MAG: hypothetical protein B7Z72_06545 [Gemmatimonadetes bacterium 21-71-4]
MCWRIRHPDAKLGPPPTASNPMSLFHKRHGPTSEPAATGYSIFDAQMRVRGDVETDGTLRVDGRLEGSIRGADVVVVASGASIVGNVSAREVIIGGTVTGNVTAGERVELQASGAVAGDVEAAAIMIQEGGRVEGRMSIHPVAANARQGTGASPVPPAPHLRTAYGGDAG